MTSERTRGRSKTEEHMLSFMLSEADKRLDAQLALMVAADGRANALLAASTALAAAAVGIAVGALKAPDQPLLAGAAIFGAMAAGAALSALWALWPMPVTPKGASPRIFRDDLANGASMVAVQREICGHLERRIELNRECARTLAARTKLAMLLLALCPIVGGGSAALVTKNDFVELCAAGLLALASAIWIYFNPYKK